MLIPRHRAFTQLTADRQFAQLGLVLIGVLAQVEAAIGSLLPPVEAERQLEETTVPGQTEGGAGAHDDMAVVVGAADFDLGVAVSRDDLRDDDDNDDGDDGGDGDVQPSIELMSPPSPRLPPLDAAKRRELDRVKDKKRKKPRVQDEDGEAIAVPTKKRKASREAEDGSSTMARSANAVPKEAKKHNKALSLEHDRSRSRTSGTKLQPRTEGTARDAKKPKKKKKKGGDEFDDLFSSLL